MKIEIPDGVERIIQKLNHQGYEAFAVGGCIRDTLLGREPKDWDITTSASPWQVKELFCRTIDTGIQHGTVTVMDGRTGYEVTTYRVDGEYEDGRHPKSVKFTSSLKEDLKRRDFTVNAMAYSHKRGLVDEFGGLKDLKSQVIRCVGKPEERFGEDALRMLRAIRFSAQLDFSIDPGTWAAVKAVAPNLKKVSKERIQAELTSLLLSPHPERIELVYQAGLSPYVALSFHQVIRSQLCIDPGLPAKKHIRWAVFLKDTEEEEAVEVLRELKLDNDTISRVRTLNRWICRQIPAGKVQIRWVMSQMEPSLFDELLLLKKSLGQPWATEMKWLTEEIRKAGDCTSLKELAISGKDLLAAGMKPGKHVGEELNRLLGLVLERPELNQKEILLHLAVLR